jgi:hypothetical protein
MTANDAGRMESTVERVGERGYIGAVFVLVAATVLIVSIFDDTIDGRLAWILVTVLALGYMIGSGLERSGIGRR